jgi:hypothetical protein
MPKSEVAAVDRIKQQIVAGKIRTPRVFNG